MVPNQNENPRNGARRATPPALAWFLEMEPSTGSSYSNTSAVPIVNEPQTLPVFAARPSGDDMAASISVAAALSTPS